MLLTKGYYIEGLLFNFSTFSVRRATNRDVLLLVTLRYTEKELLSKAIRADQKLAGYLTGQVSNPIFIPFQTHKESSQLKF